MIRAVTCILLTITYLLSVTFDPPPLLPSPSLRALLLYHQAALLATRDFWRLLLHRDIPLVTLTTAFRRIDKMEVMADKTYKLVLER